MRASHSSSERKPARLSSLQGVWLYGLFFLLGAAAAVGFRAMLVKAPAKAVPATQQAAASAPGPWGELEYTTMQLDRPDESFSETPPAPTPIEWRFEGMSREQVEALIQGSDLTEAQRSLLLAQNRWKQLTNGWSILPPLELVRDMGPAARATLYGVLKKIPSNPFIYSPVRIPVERFEAWLGSCALDAPKTELVRRLAMRERDRMCFYDAALMEWLCSPAEQRSFAKAMVQTQTLLVKLRVTPQSDINALERYWARGNRGKTMRAFLESLTRVRDGTSVSVSFFFPSFARMRLYTFPDAQHDRLAYHQDCFWTAMNFFNEQPDYSFFNPAQIQAKLRSEYATVPSPGAFGDLIMLKDGDLAVHMCVYVADDVVFTKNGASYLAPWVLMKMHEMLKDYLLERPLRMVVYRKKNS